MGTPASSRRTSAVNEDDLLDVSWWYYVDGLTQDQIAERLSVSRASVARMIDKARLAGIVQFRIAPKFLANYESAQNIKQAFGLRDIMVVPDMASEGQSMVDENTRLGTLAANVLLSELREGGTLGLGWGQAVSTVMSILDDEELEGIDLVSLTGGVNAYANAIRQVRSRGGNNSQSNIIPTPLYVSNPELASQLRKEETVKGALENARKVDVALTGIGGIGMESSLWRSGTSSEEDLQEVRESGAVGDLLAVFFDKDGSPVPLSRDACRIGIGMGALEQIPVVVAVAAGRAKHEAILAALKTKCIDVLVTDTATVDYLRDAIGPQVLAGS
ncbi:sugar-binding transcriptional regulator [Schaalia sp. JY-X159]|uniref:sugar-binding transcriptional regulator n=1 Tax=Schaalia sp. JY-X159 TaxID=2758575 RepID=UPI00165DEB25|nr:sugar-binding domain-containing protein [Schaalia sp. JY-X159]